MFITTGSPKKGGTMKRKQKVCTCARQRHEHGTPASYVTCGCRCLPCNAAYTHQRMDRYHGRLQGRGQHGFSRLGTRRRLEALHAIGWSGKQIGDLLGVTVQAVHRMRTQDAPIYPAAAEKVAALFEQLWDKPPIGWMADRTRRMAEKRGWAPPLAWDDIDAPDERPKHRLTRGQARYADEQMIRKLKREREAA